ncbi:inner membrane-spanning protein YciB [Sphingomonas bacterium]|uniref:inner membrane-spanning protein YciB n=1 Tax=Sphingomonas bacterium TaxID=1895847 RepID=UPI001575C78E|nr:inner membrane-spanning protein YciB [Sphingomonas bacterium]
MNGNVSPRAAGGSPGWRVAIDYAPLVVFFLANFLMPGEAARRIVVATTGSLSGLGRMEALVIAKVIVATAAFVVATIGAMLVSLVRLRAISPMLWISGGLVVVFGGLTIYFQNPNFIKVKPTIVYVTLSGVLCFGLATGRPLLQQLLGSAYPGLSPAGWRRLTVNWTIFFVGMAIVNEAVWRLTAPRPGDDPAVWVLYKVWVAIPITIVFAIANVPMLMRHGLTLDGGDAATRELPPE